MHVCLKLYNFKHFRDFFKKLISIVAYIELRKSFTHNIPDLCKTYFSFQAHWMHNCRIHMCCWRNLRRAISLGNNTRQVPTLIPRSILWYKRGFASFHSFGLLSATGVWPISTNIKFYHTHQLTVLESRRFKGDSKVN